MLNTEDRQTRAARLEDNTAGRRTKAVRFGVWQNTLTRLDAVCVVALFMLTAAYMLSRADFSLPPFEDAAMLMRYAQHLAAGHGLVWNVGEQPVDGATDFLFVLVVAALAWAGLSVELAVRLLGLLSHALTVVVVYLAIRMVRGSSRWAALLSSVYMLVGPGLGLVVAYFGTPFFVLAVTVTWSLAYRLVTLKDSRRTAWCFALAALLMGLIRPEGVFLALCMLLAIVLMNGRTVSRPVILYFVCIFLVGGGLYFLWHWNYFGYPLPNPFYKKSGGTLHVPSLVEAANNTLSLCLPFAPLFVLGLLNPGTRRQTIFTLIPVGGFVALWLLISSETNYLMRFQSALLPIVLISWPPLWDGLLARVKMLLLYRPGRIVRVAGVAVLAVAAFLCLRYEYSQFQQVTYPRDGRYGMALMLNEYDGRNYTLATTEAGLLPLYSDWRAIDTWGLNDAWIAHHGAITESYLDASRPELIVLHEFSLPAPTDLDLQWLSMLQTLKDYAKKNGYILAAAFGESRFDTHDYYVRPDFPDSAELVSRIKDMNYPWYWTGRKSNNFAARKQSAGP